MNISKLTTASLFLIFTVMVVVGCGNNNTEQNQKEHNHNEHKHNENKKTAKDAEENNSYPLDFCIVSNEKLGSMGDPVAFKHGDKEIKVCCKACIKTFNKKPEEFMKKIQEAKKSGKAPAKKDGHDHGDH